MSLLTKGIGFVKKMKHKYDAQIKAKTPVYLSPVRRIERVKTKEKVVAMTFDDGPSKLLPNPVGNHTQGLTLTLMRILDAFEAKGTFDVIGSTASSYPDNPGKVGSASWGGVKYDHYPDIFQDDQGGVLACPEIVDMLIRGGHEISSHTYEHILYGKKSLVYGGRHYLGDFSKVVADLEKLHQHLKDHHGYEIRLSRPPHYVDPIQTGLSSYDAYAVMNYQYMAASFDGAGWLPLATYEQEVEAMWKPIENALKEDQQYFCGQIIFQKDGYNMARRTPVADGLPIQLKLLTDAGYKVVTVSELLTYSPFADLGQGDAHFDAAKKLEERGYCVAYRDNTVRVSNPMTLQELCMTFFGKHTTLERIERIRKSGVSEHPYFDAVRYALEHGYLSDICKEEQTEISAGIQNSKDGDETGETESRSKSPELHNIVTLQVLRRFCEKHYGLPFAGSTFDETFSGKRGEVFDILAAALESREKMETK